MTNEGGGVYSPSHWTNCPCGCNTIKAESTKVITETCKNCETDCDHKDMRKCAASKEPV